MSGIEGTLAAVLRIAAFIFFAVLFFYLAAGFLMFLLVVVAVGAIYAFFRRGKRKEGNGFVFFVRRSEWGAPQQDAKDEAPQEEGMPRVLGPNRRREHDDDVIDV